MITYNNYYIIVQEMGNSLTKKLAIIGKLEPNLDIVGNYHHTSTSEESEGLHRGTAASTMILNTLLIRCIEVSLWSPCRQNIDFLIERNVSLIFRNCTSSEGDDGVIGSIYFHLHSTLARNVLVCIYFWIGLRYGIPE